MPAFLAKELTEIAEVIDTLKELNDSSEMIHIQIHAEVLSMGQLIGHLISDGEGIIDFHPLTDTDNKKETEDE